MFERWRDERQRKRIEQELDRRIKEEQASPGFPDKGANIRLDAAIDEANWESNELRWRIQKRETDRLCNEADLLDIELPDPAVWENTVLFSVLPTSERAKLRRRIDEEKTRRREIKAWWWKTIIAPVITVIIGLIGAVTGLVAVILSHRK